MCHLKTSQHGKKLPTYPLHIINVFFWPKIQWLPNTEIRPSCSHWLQLDVSLTSASNDYLDWI